MATKKKKKVKPTQSQEQIAIEITNKIKEAEANIVGSVYKCPELLREEVLDEKVFHNNSWRVYYEIAKKLVLTEKKSVLDEVTVGMYVEHHPNVKKVYEENNGYELVKRCSEYIKAENYEGNVNELKKWSAILELHKRGFAITQDDMSHFKDIQADEIYEEYDAVLSNIFSTVADEVVSYDVCDGIDTLIDECDDCSEIGIPFHNAELLTAEVGGFNLNGNIYGLGGSSGSGKSTMTFNYLLPSAIKYNEKIVIMINEEDKKKVQKELIIWTVNNIIQPDKPINKKTLRNGKFDTETKAAFSKAVEWIKEKASEHLITIIPLERYSARIAIKIIKKYSTAFGVRMFVLDTLKESFDASTKEIYNSMMRDMRDFYDVVKPSNRNVGLFVTYQLGKGALKMRHYTNNEIGQAKSILDVMSVNLMMRRPFDDEYFECNKALKCYKIPKKNTKDNTKLEYKLEKSKYPMITFITKNRFGETDTKQIISECDLATNTYHDVAYTNVPQDW